MVMSIKSQLGYKLDVTTLESSEFTPVMQNLQVYKLFNHDHNLTRSFLNCVPLFNLASLKGNYTADFIHEKDELS